MYQNLFNLPLKPKFHNLTHYPDIMLKSGPLIHLSTLRFEAKHREPKLSANVVSSRVNITKTLAIKHQLKLCYRILSQKGFQDNLTYDKAIFQNVNSVIPNFQKICSNIDGKLFEKVYVCRSISINNTEYKIGDVILFERNPPNFRKIDHILVNSKNLICFIFKKIDIISFNEHMFAYEVKITDNLSCFSETQFYFQMVTLNVHSNSRTYITFF